MQVKRFLAANLPQALAQVKAELGEEAVILHTRQVRQQGLWGWFRPQIFEVLAAKEEQAKPRPKPAKPKKPPSQTQAPLLALEEEYQRLGQLVADLKEQLPQAPFGGAQLSIYEAMLQVGYDGELARELVQLIGVEGDLLKLEAELLGRIKTVPGLLPAQNPIVLAFVGPTGVGKTTTIAKLAARYRIRHNLQVGLATVDTYRIGAVEQLRTYAEILDVPFEVAMIPQELKASMEKLREHCQVILLDTAGRSQQNKMQLAELKSFLQAAAPDQVHLVTSGTGSLASNRQVLESFKKLGPSSLIITKLDEVASFGPVASVILEGGLPLSYLANGQAVPDDLEPAEKKRVVQLCLEGIGA